MATLTGPITGGARGWPFGAAAFDLGALGYVEQEFIFEGEAVRYRHAPGTGRSFDGRWTAAEAGRAPFRSRILVRRPADASRFNGTVVVLWNNVSLGFDIFAGESPEIYRGGFAVALVSAQRVGVHGFPATPERALTEWDPARYGALRIDSDDDSYDIFTQAARLLGRDRPRSPDPLGGLDVRKMVATGASQSAVRLATYLNAIQPRERAFDGFYLHVYFGNGAPLEEPAAMPRLQRVEDVMPAALRMGHGTHLLRDDQDVPVFVMNSETESAYFRPVRQPDTDRFRFWEVAGVGHGRADGSDFLTSSWPRDLGLDRHPMAPLAGSNILGHEAVNSAALTHVHRWLHDGVAPPVLPRIAFAGEPPRVSRDDFGIALGGVRLPQIEAPTARHTGAEPDGLLQMFGATEPFSADALRRLYPDRGAYVEKVTHAATAAVAAGYLLRVDADLIIQRALAESL